MVLQHHLVIHLIDMVAGQNQHIVRIKAFHISQILVNRVRGACVPFRLPHLLIGRKNRNAADILIQIPGNTDTDMGIQSERLVLSKHANGVNTGVDTVTQRKIDNSVFTAKSHGRFRNLRGKNPEPGALSAGQKHGYHLFLYHIITPNTDRLRNSQGHYSTRTHICEHYLQF